MWLAGACLDEKLVESETFNNVIVDVLNSPGEVTEEPLMTGQRSASAIIESLI